MVLQKAALSIETGAVNRFLRKAAHLQHVNPNGRIAPLFVARRAHDTLVKLGKEHGFLVASTSSQLVKSDNELTSEAFAEVRDELGYADMLLDRETTNYHRGIASKMIPKHVTEASEIWRRHYTQYLNIDDTPLKDLR